MLAEASAAEDAAQETFIAAWRHRERLRGSVLPWLLRIAVNKSRDQLRRRARRPANSLERAIAAGAPEPATPEPEPESAALSLEFHRRLREALDQLPCDQRLAVILSDIEGLDYAEIAAATSTPLGTVKSRISGGRNRLRRLLAPTEGAFAERDSFPPVSTRTAAYRLR